MGDTQVFVTPDAMTIEVIDRTSPSLEINIDEKRVTVEGAVRPVVNVSYTGGRGPIWLPGNTYDGTSLAAILAGYIGKAQLAQDLLADIDSTITGLVDARAELASAIQTNINNGTRIDDVVSRITQAEDTLELSVAKLNAAESNISNAQVFIDDASVRLSAAEGSISNASNYIATQETILSNEWTVKIQENSDGTACVAGTGLLVYPTWKLDIVYDIDDYSWFDGNAYKAIIAHTASEENVPPNSSYWQLMPYATKSQFGVLAESFFVQTGTGEKAIPFIVQDDQVMINGDLTVNGLIESGALSSNKIWVWSVQSQNYVPGVSGYSINAITGHAELNNIDLTINYNDLTDKPTSLDAIDNVAANKLNSIQSGATSGNGNLFPNSNFSAGVGKWEIDWAEGGTVGLSAWLLDLGGDSYRPSGLHTFGFYREGSTGAASGRIVVRNTYNIQCIAGQKIEVSSYILNYRCYGAVGLLFFDANGSAIGEFNSDYNTVKGQPPLTLATWSRVGTIGTAPKNASFCQMRFWVSATTESHPHFWATNIFVGIASAGQVDLTPWSPGDSVTAIMYPGTTKIHGGNIYTNSITADKISVDKLSAIKTNTGSLTVDEAIIIGNNNNPAYIATPGKSWTNSTGGVYIYNDATQTLMDVGNADKYIRFNSNTGLVIGGDIVTTGNIKANNVTTTYVATGGNSATVYITTDEEYMIIVTSNVTCPTATNIYMYIDGALVRRELPGGGTLASLVWAASIVAGAHTITVSADAPGRNTTVIVNIFKR